MSRPFHLVDVFGATPFTGNPLAVVSAAEGLSTAEMQAMTRWLNLSETAFLLPPTTAEADYRVRIFTLAQELPFAGHPTLGTAHVWLETGGQARREGEIIQECGVGLVKLQQQDGRLAFAAPTLRRSGPLNKEEIAEVAGILRIPSEKIQAAVWADNGPGWIAVRLAAAEDVLALDPDRYYPRRIDIGVVGPHAPGHETAFELRAFFYNAQGALIEDPVTGSLNASVGQWLFADGLACGSYLAAQGTKLGRKGRIYVSQDEAGQVWVGGKTQNLVSGQSRFDANGSDV